MSNSGRALPALLILCLLGGALARPCRAAVRLWEVPLNAPGAYQALLRGGFDVAYVRPGHLARVLGEDAELARLQALGFEPRLLDPDLGRTLARRSAAERPSRPAGARLPRGAALQAVPPLGSGSLGGFYSTAEIKAFLDSLVSTDSLGLLSRVDTVGWTWRHRPLWLVRLTGPGPGPKPRVFVNALIHAREPEGMQALLHFLSLLHDGYGSDPDLTYLVDQRELYFMPLVNPDGYAVNESIYAQTGSFGLWRKNCRDNDHNGVFNNQDGVDLNRNFGFEWGYDNLGSSPTRSSEAYRGPSPWSEPETQGLRALCDSLHFASVLNFHTYSDLVLLPYGYADIVPADSAALYEWGEDFAADNHYTVGNPPRVLYAVNGGADDWAYGETAEKPRAWSLTTEVGSPEDDFWPPPSRIVPLAEEPLRTELGMAYLAGSFLRLEGPPAVTTGGGHLHPGQHGTLRPEVRNWGVSGSGAGPITATLRSADGLVPVQDSVCSLPPLAAGQSGAPVDSGWRVYVGTEVPPGRVLNFRVHFADAGGYSGTDSFQVLVGTPATVFGDSAEAGMARWTSTGWGPDSSQRHDGVYSFSDSPYAHYPTNADRRLTLAHPLDLSALANAYLCFWTRWDMETFYDCGTVEISADSGATWTPLAGRFTRPGAGSAGAFAGGSQPLGAPVYDALRHEFVEERMDLTQWTGPLGRPVLLRFRLRSDSGTERDGWYVDGIRVLTYTDAVPLAAGDPARAGRLQLGPVRPSPSRGPVGAEFDLPAPGRAQAAVFGVDGRRVAVLLDRTLPAGHHFLAWDGRASAGGRAAPGVYFLRLTSGGREAVRRLVLIR